MPEKATIARARADKRAGKAPSTQAGEFVKEEMDHIREGKHGAKSAKQAIAIGLSKARRAGVAIKPKGKAAKPVRKSNAPVDPERSAAAKRALQKQPRRAASHLALSRHAHAVARSKTKAERSAAGRKAARTRARSSTQS